MQKKLKKPIVPLIFTANALILSSFLLLRSPSVLAAPVNLVKNPSMETGGAVPDFWLKGKYGTNSATFTYPVPGLDSTRAVRVNMTSYRNGDAKWYFTDIAVQPSTKYVFSDMYMSNVGTGYTIQYKTAAGALSYVPLGNVAAAATPTTKQFTFTTPANATSMTIFHVIAKVGFLITDNYSLVEAEQDAPQPFPPSSANLITNPSFETVGENGDPSNWARGSWGTNTAAFTYPTVGKDGNKAAKVAITSYTDGDAKWYFVPVPVTAGNTYTFTDSYKSNVVSSLVVQHQTATGVSYQPLATLPAVNNWTTTTHNITVPAGGTALTVFPLLSAVGMLEIDDFSLTLASPAPSVNFKQGIVTFAMDDGFKNIFDNGIPILNARGLKSTQYIVSRALGTSGYMTAQDVLAMQSAGHEIGGHTKTHAHLTQISPTEAHDEIADGRADLLTLGATPVLTFTYPYGEFDDTIKQKVKDAGFIGARSVNRGFNTKMSDKYALLDQHVENNVSIAEIKQWIDTARTNRTWLILEMHRQQADCGTSQYCNTTATLAAIADYLVQNNVKVVTLKEGVDLMNQ